MFPPGQGATIGVDFLIKTVEVDGDKVKVSWKSLQFPTCHHHWLHLGEVTDMRLKMLSSRPGFLTYSFKYGTQPAKSGSAQ